VRDQRAPVEDRIGLVERRHPGIDLLLRDPLADGDVGLPRIGSHSRRQPTSAEAR
jgi:hypothetical protein